MSNITQNSGPCFEKKKFFDICFFINWVVVEGHVHYLNTRGWCSGKLEILFNFEHIKPVVSFQIHIVTFQKVSGSVRKK